MTKTGTSQLKSVNVLAELERAGITFEPVSDNELKVLCPAHEDKNPSVTLNTEKKLWRCWSASCNARGDFATFLALYAKCNRSTILEDLSRRYDLEKVKTINPETVEKHHKAIFSAGPLIKALYDRGLTDADLRDGRIGYFSGRITIPIYDRQGRIRDVLRYLPGASSNKMRHTKGYSALRLYRPKDIDNYEKIWIHGGPIKALAAAKLLNPEDIGCVSTTGGEGAWNPDWNRQFEGKEVWVCMDIDAAGLTAANRIADQLAPFAKVVRIVALPLSPEKYKGGDVNDYIGQEHAGTPELLECAEKAREYVPPAIATQTELGTKHTSLSDAIEAENIGWRLVFEATCSAMDDTPYLIPSKVRIDCDKSSGECHLCPIKRIESGEHGGVEMAIPRQSPTVLQLVNAPGKTQKSAMKAAFDIPKCNVWDFKVLEQRKVRDVRLTPQLTISGEGSGNLVQPAFIIDHDVDLNVPYKMEAFLYPDPANQKATLVVNECEETVDSLATFQPSTLELDELQIFQPQPWDVASLRDKLDEIYTDLEANVTRIYDRKELHLAYDLAYHSPLLLKYNDRDINGWVNVLVCGDSAQGKSEAFLRLQEHYQLGERVECKNATVAGLLGGLQQLINRWFVSWGIIPTHDMRLVALEEIKGAAIEVLGKLTDMRSSGIAEIPKIERRRAHARTRLIFISNPRSNRQVKTFGFGVEAFMELMGSPEDLRRFDLAIMTAQGEVDASVMHEKREAEHVYTSELSRRLVLWAWTRDRDQVVFTDKALDVLQKRSLAMSAKFSENIPLVDRGTFSQKLARLSAALAARTYSCVEDDKLLVRDCHVRVLADYVEAMYSSPAVGYHEYSRAQEVHDTLRNPGGVRQYLTNTKYPRSLVQGLLSNDKLQAVDFQDFTGLDRTGAGYLLSYLVRHNAMRRVSFNAYAKTGQFIDLLHKLEDNGLEDQAEVSIENEM